jgi:hypothetical protein
MRSVNGIGHPMAEQFEIGRILLHTLTHNYGLLCSHRRNTDDENEVDSVDDNEDEDNSRRNSEPVVSHGDFDSQDFTNTG